jgi:hypothetical protein
LDLSNADDRVVMYKRVVQVLFYGAMRITQEGWRAGRAAVSRNETSSVTINEMDPPSVTKVYAMPRSEADSLANRLGLFYQETADVRGVEHVVMGEAGAVITKAHYAASTQVTFGLQPVGVTRLPLSLAELRVAIRQISATLDVLHQRGWVFCDLRWPNIVLDTTDPPVWTLIDAEYVCRVGTHGAEWTARRELRSLKADPLGGASASPLSDMFALGGLIKTIAETSTFVPSDLLKLADDLVGPAAAARQVAFRYLLLN